MNSTIVGDQNIPMSSAVGPDTQLSERVHVHRRISWAAIFGAVILIISIQVLFSLLGAGIGLGTVNTNAGTTPGAAILSVGAGVWWIISSFVALMVGGYVAGWLAGIESRRDGVLHGLVAWGIATLLTFWLLTSAIGGIAGGGFSMLRDVSSATGKGMSDALTPLAQGAGLNSDSLQQTTQAYLQPTDSDPTTMSPQDAQKAVAMDLATYAKGGDDAQAAKQRVIAIMAAQMRISPDQASARFDRAQAKFTQAREQALQTAKNAADASASVASKTSFAVFGVMLLGAVAAALGGSMANNPVAMRLRSQSATVRPKKVFNA
jgi:hypothetical protein